VTAAYAAVYTALYGISPPVTLTAVTSAAAPSGTGYPASDKDVYGAPPSAVLTAATTRTGGPG
jgi:hypothetical protein